MSIDILININGADVTTQTRTNTLDAANSPIATFATRETVRGWPQRPGPAMVKRYGADRMRTGWRILFPAGTDVRSDDRLLFAFGGTTRTVDVLGIGEPGLAGTGGPLAHLAHLVVAAAEDLPRT